MFQNLMLDPTLITDYFALTAISNSKMGRINPEEGGTPKQYKGYIMNNLEFRSKATDLGSNLHLYSLEKEKFVTSSITKPSFDTKAGIYTDAYLEFMTSPQHQLTRLKAGIAVKEAAHIYARKKADYAERYSDDYVKGEFKKSGEAYVAEIIQNPDKIFLTQLEVKQLDGMIASLHAHPIINQYLFSKEENWEVYNELPILTNIDIVDMIHGEIVSMPVKIKVDRLVIDYDNKVVTVIDLKTTGNDVMLFKKSVYKLRYYRQAGFYSTIIMHVLDMFNNPENGWRLEYKNYVVETKGIYEAKIFNMSPTFLNKGIEEAKNLLSRLAYHITNDDWNYSIEEIQSKNLELELTPSTY